MAAVVVAVPVVGDAVIATSRCTVGRRARGGMVYSRARLPRLVDTISYGSEEQCRATSSYRCDTVEPGARCLGYRHH